jgi:hypothetical protein
MHQPLLIAALTLTPLLAAGAALAEDRYGPPPDRQGYDAPNTLSGVVSVAVLTWPGKPSAPLQSPSIPTAPAAPPLPAPVAAPATSTVAAQPLVSPGTGAPPRFYSVVRQYGGSPDPIVLTPQFLADSGAADLAEPPPLPPPHSNGAQTANMSAAAAASQARAAAEAVLSGNSAADSSGPN